MHKSHGVPPAGDPRGASPGRAGRRPRALPPRRRQPAAGRRHHRAARPGHRGPSGVPPARRRHRRDRQHHRPLRDLRALPRPGRRLLGAAVRTTGSASTSRCTRPATARCCSASSPRPSSRRRCVSCRAFTDPTITTPRPAARRAGQGPRRRLRARGRRARGRAHRRRRPDPQRPRRHHRLDEHLRADVPARPRPPRRDRRRCSSPPPPRSPTASAGASAAWPRHGSGVGPRQRRDGPSGATLDVWRRSPILRVASRCGMSNALRIAQPRQRCRGERTVRA